MSIVWFFSVCKVAGHAQLPIPLLGTHDLPLKNVLVFTNVLVCNRKYYTIIWTPILLYIYIQTHTHIYNMIRYHMWYDMRRYIYIYVYIHICVSLSHSIAFHILLIYPGSTFVNLIYPVEYIKENETTTDQMELKRYWMKHIKNDQKAILEG